MSDNSSALRSAWVQPGALAVLQIIGGDIVQCALAQLSGTFITPVAFSFGWVAYAFSAMVSAVGRNKLMPDADFDCIVINASDGYVRDNTSWIIGRIVRDFDFWKPKLVEEIMTGILEDARQSDIEGARRDAVENNEPLALPPKRERAGLCITIFEASSTRKAGLPVHDWVYYFGIFVSIVQLVIAAIPLIIFRDWSIILITVAGILLSLAYGALPQWKAEKWQGRRQKKNVVLTTGNGAQHAILILGSKTSLDLTDLAVGDGFAWVSTRIYVCILVILWLSLLITVIGITAHQWFLMAVGGLGMAQNVLVSGVPRKPEAFGIHLRFVRCIARPKVMDTLKLVEEDFPMTGRSMLSTFFPGDLWPDEKDYWDMVSDKINEERIAKIAQRKKDA